MTRLAKLLALGAAAALVGCSSASDPAVVGEACPADRVVGGACVGVPAAALCDSDSCSIDGCTVSTEVGTDAELSAALGAASTGACVLLRPGVYAEAIVPAGVRLLGKGADFVTVGRVELGAGQGTGVRGLTVGSGGLVVAGTVDATVDSVRVAESAGAGIELQAGSALTVTRSEVLDATTYAVSAFDVASLTIEGTLLEGSRGPGLWAQCSEGCVCASRPAVELRDTLIRDTHRVGLALVGARASVSNVEVRDNTVENFIASGGVAISACSEVTGSGLRVLDNSDFGLLIDGSTVSLTPDTVDYGLEVSRNLRGVWVQHIGAEAVQTVDLRGLTIAENTAVSLGISGSSLGVSIADAVIRDTVAAVLPVEMDGVPAGSEEVGDGFNWLDTSQVTMSRLTVSNSARASVLIDGEVGEGSSIATVTLSGGDEAFGMLQQSLPDGGVQPTVAADAPALSTSNTPAFPIVERLGIPPEI